MGHFQYTFLFYHCYLCYISAIGRQSLKWHEYPEQPKSFWKIMTGFFFCIIGKCCSKYTCLLAFFLAMYLNIKLLSCRYACDYIMPYCTSVIPLYIYQQVWESLSMLFNIRLIFANLMVNFCHIIIINCIFMVTNEAELFIHLLTFTMSSLANCIFLSCGHFFF